MRQLSTYVLALFVWCFGAASIGLAQEVTTSEADKGFIVNLLQDNLSSEGTQVRIEGFRGALSSSVEFDELTIADADGVWLTLRGAVLVWNRKSLLAGRVEIDELSAKDLIVARKPLPAAANADATVSMGFALPEIPISVDIAKLAIERAEFGETVLGQPAEMSLAGNVSLARGKGVANLEILRIDGKRGEFTVETSYENESRQLVLALKVSEEADGIASNLIGLPGNPSVDLTVQADAPLRDFTAEIALKTDGEERLAGVVRYGEINAEATNAATKSTSDTEVTHTFGADITGDISPLFALEYQDFFGPNILLKVDGQRQANGVTRVDALTLTSQSLDLNGTLILAADNLPQSFALKGKIADLDGAQVLLPIGGAKTEVESIDLDLSFDAAKGEAWHGIFRIQKFNREGLSARDLTLNGGGTITREGKRAVTANFDFDGNGIDFGTEALGEALGENLIGQAKIAWADGDPLTLKLLRFAAGDTNLIANGDLAFGGENLAVNLNATAQVGDLATISGLVGRRLSGSAIASLGVNGELGDGLIDATIALNGQDLTIDQAQVDRLLRGASVISAELSRQGDQIILKSLKVDNPLLVASGSGAFAPTMKTIDLNASLSEIADIEPRLSGPFDFTLKADQNGNHWQYDLQSQGLAGNSATLSTKGTATDTDGIYAVVNTLDAKIANLGVLARISGQNLNGGATVHAESTLSVDPAALDQASYATELDLSGSDLGIGQAQVDRLLRGGSTVTLVAKGIGPVMSIEGLNVATSELAASASGTIGPARTALDLNVRLANVATFAPDYPGPLTVSGSANSATGGWQLDLSGTGPAGITANISGLMPVESGSANLAISGTAPLALANASIAPALVSGAANYDLTLRGPLTLASLSGTVTASGAKLVSPRFGITLDPIAAQISLADGRANLNVDASIEGGGTANISGPMTLSAPYNAELALVLNAVKVIDPRLYETLINADLAVSGALTGGAGITGNVTIGKTELQVPSGAIGAGGDIPEITHIGESRAAQTTRERAGLIIGPQDANSGSKVAYPLDVVISAPNQIFIRGRGLDAELGGQFRISGTSANVVATGGLDLLRGRLDILGKRLDLIEGTARLQGGLDPYLLLVGATTAKDVQILVTVEGSATAPEITFSSNPELPSDEVISQLLFERDLTQLSAFQAVQLVNAIAVLTGKSDGGIVTDIRENLGVDDLDVTTGEDGTVGVRAGKYLSENLYTDVEISSGTSQINLNFDVTDDVTARGSAASDGETSIGLFYELDY